MIMNMPDEGLALRSFKRFVSKVLMLSSFLLLIKDYEG